MKPDTGSCIDVTQVIQKGDMQDMRFQCNASVKDKAWCYIVALKGYVMCW